MGQIKRLNLCTLVETESKMAWHLEAARTILERREKFAKFYESSDKTCIVFHLNWLHCKSSPALLGILRPGDLSECNRTILRFQRPLVVEMIPAQGRRPRKSSTGFQETAPGSTSLC